MYFLTERKFGRNPSLLAFSTLLQHLHTKTLDGFLGRLPASWMEQVTPSATTALAPVSQGRGGGWVNSDTGGAMVMNTNYQVSFQEHWQAAGHTSIAQLLQAYTSTEVKSLTGGSYFVVR